MANIEKFYGILWKQGDSLVVTVPRNIVKFVGYAEKDKVNMTIQKVKE